MKVQRASGATGQVRLRAKGPAWRACHNVNGQETANRQRRHYRSAKTPKRRAAHRLMPSTRCCGSSSLRIAWESHVYLRGQRRPNWRLWAGTRAPAQHRFCTHAARALLLGPGVDPEQAGGPPEWWVTAWAAASQAVLTKLAHSESSCERSPTASSCEIRNARALELGSGASGLKARARSSKA